MKKFIYILFATLLATACVEPLQPYLGPIVNEPEEGAPVTIEFTLPPMTKADWGNKPTIETMHVAVFNERGVLKQYQQATLTNPAATVDNPQVIDNGDQGANNPKYSVEINMSSNKRILHFIANSPVSTLEELIALAGTSGEDAILNKLSTSGGDAAYWQRIELDKIDAYTYNGTSYTAPGSQTAFLTGNPATYTVNNQTIKVYQGDFIKSTGEKVLDGTGYFMSDYVKGLVANVPLVRNYAEIEVTEKSGSNFHPTKFALVYVPKAGSVAPFDAPSNAFAKAYECGTTSFSETLDYTTVHNTGYPGFLAGGIDPNFDPANPNNTTFIDFATTNGVNAATSYMYERPLPTAQQLSTCILICGNLDNVGNNRWFKIELTDQNGAYFPIYRGLSYDFEIGNIDGTKGYESAADAFNHDPIGDVSGSVTTATLEQISDGKGTTLWVQYIDYVATQAENKTIYYTMYYQASAGSQLQYLTNSVTLKIKDPANPEASTYNPQNVQYRATDATTLSGSQYTGTGTPDDTKTWYVATVPLKAAGDHALHSILRVEGTTPASTGSKKMHRDVHYRVMGTQEFQNGDNKLKAKPLEDELAGRPTTLTIYLPGDLGYSMFPITLKIEAEDSNLTTADGLPVESGPSMFDPSKNTFYFLKTIEYDDYFNAETGAYTYAFTAEFKTTRDGGSSAKGTNATRFAVQDKIKTGRTTPYFNLATCDLKVGGPVFQLVGDSPVSVAADVEEVTMRIKNTSGGTWSLTKGEGVISVSPESGSTVDGEITVTIRANTDENNAKTYTVTAKLDAEHAALVEGYEDLTFTINQAAKSTKYYTINLDAGGSNSTYGYPWVPSTVNPDSNTYRSYQSNNEGRSNSIATMSVTVVGYTEFTVYIRSNAEDRNAYYYSYDYDYTIARKIGELPLTSWTSNSAYSNSGTKAYTRRSTDTTISGYTAVTFTTSDGLTDDLTPHTFYIQFGKDGSGDSYDDRGYVLIPYTYNLPQ